MLIVNVHALTAVDALHLPYEVGLHSIRATDAQDVMRNQRTVHERIAFLDIVAGVNAEMLAVRHQVLAFFADGFTLVIDRLDQDRALAAAFLPQADDASDLGHDGGLARPARLKDFRDAGQAARDVLGSAYFARRLGQQRTGRHLLILANLEMRFLWHIVKCQALAAVVLDDDLRVQVPLVFHDHPAFRPARIAFPAERLAFDDLVE